MAELSKAGDIASSKYYEQFASSMAAKSKEVVVPPHQRAQQVAADIKRKERKLEHEFGKLCRWRAELEEQKSLVQQCEAELGGADKIYQSAVKELASATLPKEPGPVPQQADIEDLYEGKVAFESLFNLDSLFNVQNE
eukprot:8701104-Pyramimonas_sp.AAC.1